MSAIVREEEEAVDMRVVNGRQLNQEVGAEESD
jgi:hypothetical protein